jgi:hypothetical protein
MRASRHYVPSRMDGLNLNALFRHIQHKEYRRAVGTYYWQTRRHQVCYSPRHRRDSRAGTMILIISASTAGPIHSLPAMTTGRTELLEHGHRRRIQWGRRTFQGPRAGWSSGRTTPEYTAARRRHDHATFLERADAPVRCKGLGARLLANVQRGQGRV